MRILRSQRIPGIFLGLTLSKKFLSYFPALQITLRVNSVFFSVSSISVVRRNIEFAILPLTKLIIYFTCLDKQVLSHSIVHWLHKLDCLLPPDDGLVCMCMSRWTGT